MFKVLNNWPGAGTNQALYLSIGFHLSPKVTRMNSAGGLRTEPRCGKPLHKNEADQGSTAKPLKIKLSLQLWPTTAAQASH
jgi:hypothetical protein